MPNSTGRENIILQCRYYHIPTEKARQRANTSSGPSASPMSVIGWPAHTPAE